MAKKVYWTILQVNHSSYVVAATEVGLCYIGSPNDEVSKLENWIKNHIIGAELIEDRERLTSCIEQLESYWKGEIRQFSMPIDMQGTIFQQRVWEALQLIPYGQTVSYQHIANQLGKPTAARAVGTAIGKNPVLIVVPCHRVIGASGKLTGYRGGLRMKEELLQLEGCLTITSHPSRIITI